MSKKKPTFLILIIILAAVILAAVFFVIPKSQLSRLFCKNNKPDPFSKEAYEKYSVKIKIDDGKNTTDGAGVIVSYDENAIYICTNAHILKRETIGEFEFFDGEKATYTKIFVDEDRDVALAYVARKDISDDFAKTIEKQLVLLGESAFDYTRISDRELHMLSSDGSVIDGKGVAITLIDDWELPIFEVSLPIKPGDSGCPIYDNNGYLVGIAMARWSVPGQDERFFAVSSADITNSVCENSVISIFTCDDVK